MSELDTKPLLTLPLRRHLYRLLAGAGIFFIAAAAAGAGPLSYLLSGAAAATALAAAEGYLALRAAAAFERELFRREDEVIQTSTLATERFKLLTENLAAAVIVRDRSGKILYCSPYTELLTGYPVADLYAASEDFFLAIVHEEDRARYARSLQITTLGEAFYFRFRFRQRSGQQRWAESRTVPILDDDGATVISSLSIVLDITGTVRQQRQLEEKNSELQDFTYMVSHDLKAPIFTLKGMLGILGEELGSSRPSALQEPLDHMIRALHRLEQLVTSVLEYSRASSFEPRHEPIELQNLVNEVIADFKPHLTAAGGKVEFQGELPKVFGDPLRITQVFSNLISNAIKYRSAERPLIVTISAQAAADSRTATVTVKDNGTGVPSDKVDLIFRPFQRLHGKEIEGSGVGLACARKLLERMGGDISAESDGASGMSFTLTLPAV